MNPDQEHHEVTTTTSSSVNDPYENRKTASRRKSKYAKEQHYHQPPPAPTIDDDDGDGNGTTFIVPSRSSTSMNSPQLLQSPPSQEQNEKKRRQESKELFTIHQQLHHHQQDEFYSKNLLIASTLVVTYLIEVTVQILLIVQCCRSILKLELVMDSLLESTTSSISSWSWVLVMSSVGSSLLVTLISIIWVFRGMDFSGRICGRLLCYVMHSFLLALLWRYLKLAFAYDRADLEEFFRLKTIQSYVQSLPLVTIHLAWLLTAQQLLPVYFNQSPFDSYHALSSWLVVAEMLSVVMSLLVLSSVSSSKLLSTTATSSSSSSSPPTSSSAATCTSSSSHNLRGRVPKKQRGKGDDNNPNHQFNDSGTASQDGKEKMMMMMKETRLLTRVAQVYSRKSEPGRGLLLISRLISLGMLVYEMNYWTGFITLLHLAVCFAWLSLWVILTSEGGDENENAGNSTKTVDVTKLNKNYCDSSASANDSGLVVKSDVFVKMENELDYCKKEGGQANNNSELDAFNLAKCLSVIIHRDNNSSSGNNTAAVNNPPGNINVNVRQVLIHVVLPLTYLLFWDLSPVPSLLTVTGINRLNLWATTLPVFLTAVENLSITIFHVYNHNHNQQNMIWTVASGTCLLCGWLLVAASHFQKQRRRAAKKSLQASQEKIRVQVVGGVQVDSELEEDENDDDANANPSRQKETGIRMMSRKEKSVNKKETGECLSMCCSSLSHPLNIKRKGHAHHQEHNFCAPNSQIDNDNDYDKKDFGNEHNHAAAAAAADNVILKVHNEYEYSTTTQPELMTTKQHNHNSTSSGRRQNERRLVVKNSIIMFPDLGITSAHTGVGGVDEQVVGVCVVPRINAEEKMMMNFQRCQENVVVACAPAPTTTPVTNNYTNIKEALTRRISNKSCASSSKKQSHHQHHHCMNQDRESVKGEVEGGLGEVVISSFKSSSTSSPSTRLPQPPTTTNSNKCMPISIKSPISWLPETCCNDSSGSGGSSNSRNTNTLLPSSDPRTFYCPENYIDLDNNNEKPAERPTPKPSRVLRRGGSDDCDFSIVFFEDRDRGTTRKLKQKQSRAGVVGAAAGNKPASVLRPVRSANATPVVSSNSKQFPPLDMTVRQQQHQHFHHPHSHHEHDHHRFIQQAQTQYSLDDDPIERASRGTRRNQIMGKTYLSDGGSLTSLDGLCEIRASTPVEIKKASRVIVNYPPPHHQIEDSKTVSRCLCKVESSSSPTTTKRKCPNDDGELVNNSSDKAIVAAANNIYEKLIDDSYGILICEGENTPHHRQSGSGAVSSSRKNNCYNNGGGIGSKKCIVSSNNKVTIGSEAAELSSSCRVGGGGGGGVLPSQKLRILCAKCLENHDPLLTNCLASALTNNNNTEELLDDDEEDDDDNEDHEQDQDENSPYTNKNHYNPSSINVNANNINVNLKNHHHHVHFGEMNKSLPHLVSQYPTHHHSHHHPGSDTTDYPSDTEFTTNNGVVEDDGQSLSTHFSSATCNWHHNPYQPTQLSQFIWAASSMMPTSSSGGAGGGGGSSSQCPKEFTSLEYVRTWLMASHPRTFAINNNINNINTVQHPHHHQHHQNENRISENSKRGFCQSAGGDIQRHSKTLTPRSNIGDNN